jgi:hypothetical protein
MYARSIARLLAKRQTAEDAIKRVNPEKETLGEIARVYLNLRNYGDSALN